MLISLAMAGWLVLQFLAYWNHRALFSDHPHTVFHFMDLQAFYVDPGLLRCIERVLVIPLEPILKTFGTQIPYNLALRMVEACYMALPALSLLTCAWLCRHPSLRRYGTIILAGNILSQTMTFAYPAGDVFYGLALFWPALLLLKREPRGYFSSAVVCVLALGITYSYEAEFPLLIGLAGFAFLNFQRTRNWSDLLPAVFSLACAARMIYFLATFGRAVQEINAVPSAFGFPKWILELALITLLAPALNAWCGRRSQRMANAIRAGALGLLCYYYFPNLRDLYLVEVNLLKLELNWKWLTLIFAAQVALVFAGVSRFQFRENPFMAALLTTAFLAGASAVLREIQDGPNYAIWSYAISKQWGIFLCAVWAAPLAFNSLFEKFWSNPLTARFISAALIGAVVLLAAFENQVNREWSRYFGLLNEQTAKTQCHEMSREELLLAQKLGADTTSISKLSLLIQGTWSPAGVVFASRFNPQAAQPFRPSENPQDNESCQVRAEEDRFIDIVLPAIGPVVYDGTRTWHWAMLYRRPVGLINVSKIFDGL